MREWAMRPTARLLGLKPPTRDFPCPPPTSARKVKDAWALITNGIDHEIIHCSVVMLGTQGVDRGGGVGIVSDGQLDIVIWPEKFGE